MKTLYLTRGNNIAVDIETNDVNRINTQRMAIDYVYLADEPMHVVYGDGDVKQEFDVEKDDIIVTFYADAFVNPAIVVKNSAWVENLKEYNKREQEEKERWAKGQAIDCGCECKG